MSDDIETKVAEYIAGTMLKQPDRTVDPQEKLISSGLRGSARMRCNSCSSV